jgi:TonB family protein
MRENVGRGLFMKQLHRILASLVFTIVAASVWAANDRNQVTPVENEMPPTPRGVYEIAKVSAAPVAVFQARPRYPFELRRAKIGGEAIILFTVAKDGTVQDAMVLRATDVRFGEAALEAVRKWKFHAAKLDGADVDCRMSVPIVFTLNEH